MSDPEAVYSARQAAERLGLSPAMTRRYGATLEEVTGEPIRQHARDGRQYSQAQVEAMIRAKGFVEANSRISVADALRLALGQAPDVANLEDIAKPETGPQALEDALTRALERSLLPELRELRAEVAALRSEAREGRALAFDSGSNPDALPSRPAPSGSVRKPNSSEDREGLLVQLARRLESWLGRG